MREALRELERERDIKVGFLVVIAARHAMIPMKKDEVKKQLDYALRRLGMYGNAE